MQKNVEIIKFEPLIKAIHNLPTALINKMEAVTST